MEKTNKNRFNIKNWFKPTESYSTPEPLTSERKVKKGVQIVKRQPTRVTPELESYQNAVLGAIDERLQDRQFLYGLYWQCMNYDAWVNTLIEKRLNNLTSKEVKMYVNDELYDSGEFFKAKKFKDFMKDVVLSKFYGFQLFQFDVEKFNDKNWFDYVVVPHQNVNPYLKEIIVDALRTESKPFSDYDNLLMLGEPNDLGKLLQITKLYVEKAMSVSFRLRYAELASENFLVEYYKQGSQANREELGDAYEEKGGGGVMSLPDTSELKFENMSSSQQNQLFKELVDDYKEEQAVAILGQSMTTLDGSSRSQAEVHQDEQQDIYAADLEYLNDFLNYEFIEYLHLYFELPESAKVEFKLESKNNADLRRKVQLIKELQEIGVTFEQDELNDMFKELL